MPTVLNLIESEAIVVRSAERLGRFLPGEPKHRARVMQLLSVLDRQFSEESYIAGDYSIGDIATYPWVTGILAALRAEGFENLRRWAGRIALRPAVETVMPKAIAIGGST